VLFVYNSLYWKKVKAMPNALTLEEAWDIIQEQRKQMRLMEEQIKLLTQKRFGKSSERSDDPGQLSIFDDFIKNNEVKDSRVFEQPETTGQETETITYQRKKKSSRQVTVSEDLPVELEELDLQDDEKFCAHCHAQMQCVGHRFVREQVCFIPAKLFRKQTFQYTYRCPSCIRHFDKPNQYYKSSPAPTPVIAHSLASPSLIAEIVHNKYELSVPGYRQVKDWQRLGLSLSAPTIANWLIKAAEWLQPLNELCRNELMKQTHIHGDETSYKVLHELGKSATTMSYLWLACSIQDAKKPVVYFKYDPHRSGAVAQKLYNSYTGSLQCDGYQAYGTLPGTIQRSGCWAHVRRKFIETGPTPNKVVGKAKVALDMINKLFKIEQDLKTKSFQERLKIRQSKSKPIVDEFFNWLNKTPVIEKSGLGKAVGYALGQQTYLMHFLEDPEIELSNNTAERHIKIAVMGRKNWLFSTSQAGAHANTLFLSLIETAKMNGLDPSKYIEYLLNKIPQLPMIDNQEQLKAYLPWTEQVQTNCIK